MNSLKSVGFAVCRGRSRKSTFQGSIESTQKAVEEEDLYSAEDVDEWIEAEAGDGPGRVCWQSLLPLFISGLGSISSGLILNMTNKLELIKSR